MKVRVFHFLKWSGNSVNLVLVDYSVISDHCCCWNISVPVITNVVANMELGKHSQVSAGNSFNDFPENELTRFHAQF